MISVRHWITIIVFCALAGSAYGAKGHLLLPVQQSDTATTGSTADSLNVNTWVSVSKKPEMYGVFIRIGAFDSVSIDFSSPQIHTKRTKKNMDSFDIWSLDKESGDWIHLHNISGFTPENSQSARMALDPGVYLIQLIFFKVYHDGVKVSDSKMTFDLGSVASGGGTLSLQGIEFEKSKTGSSGFGVPPSGSKISPEAESPVPDLHGKGAPILNPEFLVRQAPEWPRMTDSANVSCSVWVKALVDREGNVRKAEVHKSSGTVAFDEAAIAAAYKNKFKPAFQDGYPVEVWVSYKETFNTD